MSIPPSKIRVLHFSTHNEDCGIGKYQEEFLDQLQDSDEVYNEFYESSPHYVKKLTGAALRKELGKLKQKLQGFDILHIQHEFGFFRGDGEGLAEIIDTAKELNKKVVITIHTAPGLIYQEPTLYKKTPKGLAGYLKRSLRAQKIMSKRLVAFRKADLVITLNSYTRNQLIGTVGVGASRVVQTMIPIKPSTQSKPNSELRGLMRANKEDVIISTIGFISENKGIDAAIKALSFLPKKYKLAILGGVNPESGNPKIYDMMCDLIIDLNLQDRVYISGYVKEDKDLDVLVRGSDIALYPYNLEYYKLASSAAINKAISNEIPVIAYPTESFKEINTNTPHAIVLTMTGNYYELSKEVERLDISRQIKNGRMYASKNSLEAKAAELVSFYKKL